MRIQFKWIKTIFQFVRIWIKNKLKDIECILCISNVTMGKMINLELDYYFESSVLPVARSVILLYRIPFLSSSPWAHKSSFRTVASLGWVCSANSAFNIAALSSLAT